MSTRVSKTTRSIEKEENRIISTNNTHRAQTHKHDKHNDTNIIYLSFQYIRARIHIHIKTVNYNPVLCSAACCIKIIITNIHICVFMLAMTMILTSLSLLVVVSFRSRSLPLLLLIIIICIYYNVYNIIYSIDPSFFIILYFLSSSLSLYVFICVYMDQL